jgi:hypothetical protein
MPERADDLSLAPFPDGVDSEMALGLSSWIAFGNSILSSGDPSVSGESDHNQKAAEKLLWMGSRSPSPVRKAPICTASVEDPSARAGCGLAKLIRSARAAMSSRADALRIRGATGTSAGRLIGIRLC